MPVLLVLVEDPAARDPLVETLRGLFPWARVVAVRVEVALPFLVGERATVVVAALSAAERLSREGVPPDMPVIALTRDMSPDTLMRAEALGIAGAVRVPADAERLAAALGPMLKGSRPRDHQWPQDHQ
jgi:DNA-binding NarL/FixJ family response regulator